LFIVYHYVIKHKRKCAHKPLSLELIFRRKKENMNKANRMQVTKILVFVTYSVLTLFFLTFSTISGTFLHPQAWDDWEANPMYISPFAGSPTPIGYSPDKLRTAYNLPALGGAGTTIAIIDAYDTPDILNCFNTFSNQYGLPDNSTGNFIVHKMPGTILTDSNWSLETCLDVEWTHAIAPNAKILLVEAVSNSRNNLLSAVDYATSQPGVVTVSMSWGDNEFSSIVNFDSHFNKPGITFFAASGDDGSNVIWPAVSANVVSVGGTTLNLKPDGIVISEIAWRNSSGGVSKYIAKPIFQTNFGLTYANRAVPDVSYNGDPSTGVAVYNGSWWKVGGTSAGAPQWAAIHALGLSATNVNLYNRAKSAFSSYFRDITEGSNYVNSTTPGYDLVTGLGSPLTTNFRTKVTVTPSAGPANGSVTINGEGFALSNSVNISYSNPINSSWIPLTNNLTITSDTFSYAFNAPDLFQNNSEGDNQPKFDNIIFRVVDDNNHSYTTTVPYTEWRRGIAQIGTSTAVGLYGNNTNFVTSVFVQNGDSVPLSGYWFIPGNITVLWDNTTSLGTIATDNTGFFNTTLTVPPTPAGPHTLKLNDGATNFCINITRLPTVTNDYQDGWHTTDFLITLNPDYAVNESFYRINDGPVSNITANGQPAITTEGSNKLEYGSTWDIYGTGMMELPRTTLVNIKLDKTVPTGSITPSNTNVNFPIITLDLSATDDVSGVAQMRFSNGNSDWLGWEAFATSKIWILPTGDGAKTVNVQFKDAAGLTSQVYSCMVNFAASTATPNPADSATIKPADTASPLTTPAPSTSPINSATIEPSVTPQIPEANTEMFLILLASSSLTIALLFKKSAKKNANKFFCKGISIYLTKFL
jgi:hypothetical protein